MTTDKRPLCCGKPMMKAGKAWSGTNKVQAYKCNQCGRKTTKQG